MLDFVWALIQHTPIWVYVLFVFLMYKGFECFKDQWVPFKVMLIFPAVFLAMAIESMWMHFGWSLQAISYLMIGFISGVVLGRVYAGYIQYQYALNPARVFVPGSKLPLFQIMMIFSAKYYFGYIQGRYPDLAQGATFMFESLGVSGICSGLFIGPVLKHMAQFRVHQD